MTIKKGFYFRGPAHVDFNLTNGCNLSCSHCHSSSGAKLENELTTDEILKIIEDLHQLGIASIAFAGGEPFVRKDIIEILKYASSLSGWSVSVITNGFYCQPRTLDAMIAKCPNVVVNVSLDGSNPENFSTLRKQKNGVNNPAFLFDRVISGIRNVVASGLTNSVNFTVTKATINDLVASYQLAIETLKAGNFVAIKFFPGGYGKAFLDLYELSYELWSQHFAKWTAMKLAGKLDGMQISTPSAWEFYLPLIQAGIDLQQAEKSWRYRSPLREKVYRESSSIGDVAGIAELCIGGDGNVYPSVLFCGVDEVVCGNTRDHTIDEIWHNSTMLNAMRSTSITDIGGDCGNCQFHAVCGGGSRSRAYSLRNTVRAADMNCPILPNKQDCDGKSLPVIKPSALLTSDNQCNMFIMGDGRDAFRFFFDQDNCEIRYRKYILHCNSELSEKLRILLADQKIKDYFLSTLDDSPENTYSKLQEKLNVLVADNHTVV